jgi:hypothetical protein
MTRPKGRTAGCTLEDARRRLRQAESFIYVARLTLGERVELPVEDDDLNVSGVAAALVVLAGIAAADAACCARLGQRSRGRDHKQAASLVRTVVPGGEELAKDLDRLLHLKDSAHYGVLGVSDGEAAKAVEWAERMARLARQAVEG